MSDLLAEALDEIHALHTDSVAGVCPSCYRLADVSETDDGLVGWPCPTVQAVDRARDALAAARCEGWAAAIAALRDDLRFWTWLRTADTEGQMTSADRAADYLTALATQEAEQ